MTKKDETLTFEEKFHIYRLIPSGKIVPGVTEIINAVFPFWSNGERFDRACQFGAAVHKLIELDINGTLDNNSIDPNLQAYYSQYLSFIFDNNFFKTKYQTEVMLYSKNYDFAGRIDLVEKRIIDWKTGQQAPTHRLKIAAYRHLWNLNNPEDKLKDSWIVYLNGSKNPPLIVKEQPSDFGVFLSCLNVYNFKKQEKI